MPILRLENISKDFHGVQILKDINLETNENEFIVLLGKTGSGKSTLLRIIAGLETPTTGRVFWDNVDITYFPPEKRNISMIFQNYPVYPHFNVFDNIAIPLKLLKVSKPEIKNKVINVAKKLDIDKLLNRNVTNLSGGEQQKVAIAKSMIKNPSFFLFDEPLSNIDTRDKAILKQLIKNLHKKERKVFIYVTHDQSEAISLADRIALLQDSKIVQFDTSEVIYKNPVNAFVGDFFGNQPLNMLSCKIIFKQNRLFLETSFGLLEISKNKTLLKNYSKSSVIIGIRPDRIILTDSKNDLTSSIKKVEYSWGSYLIWISGSDNFRIKSNFNLSINTKCNFTLPEDDLLFFDINTREKL